MIVGSLLLILVAVMLLVLGLASGSSGLLIGSIAVSLLAAVALVVGARQAAGARGGTGFAADDERFVDDGVELDDGGEGEPAPSRRRPPTSTRMAPTDPRLAGAGRDGGADPFDVAGPVLTDPRDVAVPGQANRSGMDPDIDDAGWRQPADADADIDDAGWRQPANASEMPGSGPVSRGEPGDDAVPADEPAAQVVSEADAALVAGLVDDVYVVDGRPRYHLADCPHLHSRESEPVPVGEAVELGFSPCGRCEPDSFLLADARRG
ncbi:hypothetical protein [Plantactinospora soyae]|uniref:Uncharacterized protein n=1 Tax=Plantactinospora soyae TaxID=1544732 RepID=A0A927R2A9_9ACTN|nr:hypothetical protein [Plantactinospora soyae]MBE1492347.1 hypothetical protein [Plantactinospora soyae]